MFSALILVAASMPAQSVTPLPPQRQSYALEFDVDVSPRFVRFPRRQSRSFGEFEAYGYSGPGQYGYSGSFGFEGGCRGPGCFRRPGFPGVDPRFAPPPARQRTYWGSPSFPVR